MDIQVILKETDFEKVISYLQEDKLMITRLFSYENKFSSLLNFILKNKEKNQYIESFSHIFLDILVGRLLRKPSDLLCCLQKVRNENLQLSFLTTIMRHHLINDDLLVALGESRFVFERLPQDMSWMEVPIIAYGSKTIRTATTPLTMQEICPLLDFAGSLTIQWLLGWAFQENKLNEEGIDYLKNNYPAKYELILQLNK